MCEKLFVGLFQKTLTAKSSVVYYRKYKL